MTYTNPEHCRTKNPNDCQVVSCRKVTCAYPSNAFRCMLKTLITVVGARKSIGGAAASPGASWARSEFPSGAGSNLPTGTQGCGLFAYTARGCRWIETWCQNAFSCSSGISIVSKAEPPGLEALRQKRWFALFVLYFPTRRGRFPGKP